MQVRAHGKSFIPFEFCRVSIKSSFIKLQNLVQMANVKSANKFQEQIARYVDERLGLILQESDQFGNLLGIETIERNLLEKTLFGLRMEGGNV